MSEQRIIKLDSQYDIFPDQPIQAFDSGEAKAFAARNNSYPEQKVYALKCTSQIPPRLEHFAKFQEIADISMVLLKASGIVNWSGQRDKVLVLILTQPQGERITPDINTFTISRPWREREVIECLIPNVLKCLKILDICDLTHRAIRPDNLFLKGIGFGSGVILGECYSAPPAYFQPMYMEPIFSARAHPSARGDSTVYADLYALGVTILMLLAGENPWAKIDADELHLRCIEEGSYEVLAGNRKISSHLQLFLRGVLSYDPVVRWGLREVENWMGGALVNVRRPRNDGAFVRPFTWEVTNRTYMCAESLVYDMIVRPKDGAQLMVTPGFAENMRSNIREQGLAKKVAEDIRDNHDENESDSAAALALAKSGEVNEKNKLQILMRVAHNICPESPFIIGDKLVQLDGLGHAMYMDAMITGGLQKYSDFIESPYLAEVIKEPSKASGYTTFRGIYPLLRKYITSKSPGFGVERVLYALCQGYPCRSEMVSSYYLASMNNFLDVMEDVAAKPGRPKIPFDKHTLAFVTENHKGIDLGDLSYFRLPKESAKTLASIKIMAALQRQLGTKIYSKLSVWMVSLAKEMASDFKNLKTRERIMQTLDELAEKGDIAKILNVVSDKRAADRDLSEFRLARTQNMLFDSEIKALERKYFENDKYVMMTGRRASVSVAGFVTVIFTGVILTSYFLNL